MAHEVYGEKFYSYRGIPWHGLGIVSNEAKTAITLYNELNIPDVEKRVIYVKHEDGTFEETNAYALYRVPDGLNGGMFFGAVGENYHLVNARRFCQIWDMQVSAPVQTLGSLRNGSILFITTGLPDFTLGSNDQIKNYLIAFSPMNGKDAIEVWVSSTRVVCMNTLRAAQATASESFKVPHTRFAEDDLAGWLNGLYARAESRVKALEVAYGSMTQVPMTRENATEYFHKVYAYPALPNGFKHLAPGTPILDTTEPSDLIPDSIRTRLVLPTSPYNAEIKAVEKAREAVEILFNGKGLGMDYDTAYGTLWGAYNGVTAWETGRRARKMAGAENLLIGDRAQTISKAYSLAMELVKA